MPIKDKQKAMDWNDGISIIIPTYKRPKGLDVALNSLIFEKVSTPKFEIIVSDNDPNGGAKDYITALSATHKNPEIVYVHAKDPGVCNARNEAMAVARAGVFSSLLMMIWYPHLAGFKRWSTYY